MAVGVGESFQAALHLFGGADDQLVSGLRLRRIDGVGGQREHAGGLNGLSAGAEGRKRFDGVEDPAVRIQVKEVEREEHTGLGDSAEWRQPESLTGLQFERFDPGFELVHRRVGDGDFKAKEALAGLVVGTVIPRFH